MSIFTRQFRVGSAPLARWSGGRPGRAALLLVGLHVGAGIVCLLPWVVGLLPVFRDHRWPITVPAIVLTCVLAPAMLLWLGFWGTAANSFQDGGEEYTRTFTPGKGFALGWLRWLMQIVMVGIMMAGIFLAWVDGRPFGLPGAEEVRSLASRAERVPAPAGGRLTSARADNNDGVVRADEGAYELEYDVPAPLSEDDLRAWLTGPGWGPAFGRLAVTSCEPTLPSCTAQAVPPDGGPAEFKVHVTGHASRYTDGGRVVVRLSYERFRGYPDLHVSGTTKERLRLIPVPADWSLDVQSVSGEKNDNGESALMAYAAPEGLRRGDVKAWLLSDAWTHPERGSAFGAIELEKCSLELAGTTWWCHAHTVHPDVHYEGIAVGYDERDGSLLVTVERNG